MPKRFIFIISVLLTCVSLTLAQETISPELQAQINQIELKTTEIRNLERLELTDLAFPSTEELEIFLLQEFEEQFEDGEFEDDLLFYVGLDLMEPGLDLEAILFDFLISQVAGFYDPETDSMNVLILSDEATTDTMPILESLTYSHEYVHALQDQHFDLEDLLDMVDASENGDFQLAITSLIEGDATQVMADYAIVLAEEDPMALAQAVLSAGEDLGGVALPENIPPIIESELVFPYLQGQVFVATIVSERGWDAIDEAFEGNYPLSTEHIYHPERYLAGEMPIEVTIPDLGDVIGDNWRMAQDTPVGEFYLRKHLETKLSNNQSRDMADGWGGDRMNLFTDDTTGDIIWVLHQVWDTPEEATEFVEGYTEFLDRRFGVVSEDGTCWTGDNVMCFTQIDDDETRISYATNIDLAMVLLAYAN